MKPHRFCLLWWCTIFSYFDTWLIFLVLSSQYFWDSVLKTFSNVTQTVCYAPFHMFSSICSHLQKKYKKKRRKTIVPFPLRGLKLFCVLGINASFTPVRLISELTGNIMWLNYLCDAWHLLNKTQNMLSASVAMLPLVLSEGWCGNFGQAIK